MYKNIFNTIIFRSAILVVNFILILLTTNLWGTEGRGILSILIADVAIISIVNNVMAGSCVAYFTPKKGIENLLLPAYIWTLIISFMGSVVISLFQEHNNFLFLFLLSALNSLLSIHLIFFTAKEKFRIYNIISVLQPVLLLFFALILEFFLQFHSYKSYIYGYIASLSVLWLICLRMMPRYSVTGKFSFRWNNIQEIFKYGFQTELSYFLQFLSYRLSYFFILYYEGINSVGVFSVGVAIAEAIWTITRSISTVQYARIINDIKPDNRINTTKEAARISLFLSFVALLILLFLPSWAYQKIFGAGFLNIKQVVLILAPGVLAIAVSNIYGHYFSASGRPKYLIIRSVIGLVVTVSSALVLIPRWGMKGACISALSNYLVSSFYISFQFYRRVSFRLNDFFINIEDLKNQVFKRSSHKSFKQV